jgi:hypothetical protein
MVSGGDAEVLFRDQQTSPPVGYPPLEGGQAIRPWANIALPGQASIPKRVKMKGGIHEKAADQL